MKEYFQHDINCISDPKIVALLSEYGGLGYGCFWRIVEMLHEDNSKKLPFKKYIFLAIAEQMKASSEQVEKLINSCIDDYELFVKEDGCFWSERVLTNFEKRDEISKKRSESGKLGAIAKQNIANAQQNLANTSKEKESKEKEKEKEDTKVSNGDTKNFQKPTESQVAEYFQDKHKCSNQAAMEFAIAFCSHYNSNGWLVGKAKMKSWQSAINGTWKETSEKILAKYNSLGQVTASQGSPNSYQRGKFVE